MFLTLLALWLIFNGRITTEIVLTGLVICAVLTFAWHKLFRNKRNTVFLSPSLVWHDLRYIGNLIIEIIRCNLQVMRLILHPKEEIHPMLVTVPMHLKKDSHKVILANSITMTPGTITVALNEDTLCVHGLDASFLDGIEDCDMARRLMKIEEDPKNV